MKAIVFTKYGSPDVLQLKELEKPTPRDNEVLVKVYAASVNSADWHRLRGDARIMGSGLLAPKHKIPGADLAGKVEAVGTDAKAFKPGDEVFGDISGCGWGAFAEYACVSEEALMLKPVNIRFEEAAAVPMAGVTALQALRDHGHVHLAQKVLINGASGGVGTFALQIAKSYGAEVTAVCSTKNVDIAHSLGADHVIDYTQEDFTKSEQRYDLILGANGYHSISDYKRALSPKGIYVMSGGSSRQMLQAMILGSWIARPSKSDLAVLKELIEAGKVRPAIDRIYPLSGVCEALRYLGEGHAKGKIVITLEHADN